MTYIVTVTHFFRDGVINIDHVQFIYRSGFSHDERPNYLQCNLTQQSATRDEIHN